jgi:hypothetical protein
MSDIMKEPFRQLGKEDNPAKISIISSIIIIITGSIFTDYKIEFLLFGGSLLFLSLGIKVNMTDFIDKSGEIFTRLPTNYTKLSKDLMYIGGILLLIFLYKILL